MDQPGPARGRARRLRRLARPTCRGLFAAARAALKERVDAVALAPATDFRRDSELFLEVARRAEAQARMRAAMRQGFQTPGGELELGRSVIAMVAA
jgi:hypothetical protein